MVTSRVAARGMLAAALLAGGMALAQEQLPPMTDPGVDPVVVNDDLDEVSEALRTLDAAQVPPTSEELARFLEEARQAAGPGSGGDHYPALNGSVLLRSGHYQDEGLDHYGKLALESRWLTGRARVRQYRYGMTEATGTIEVWGGPVEMRVGDLGMVQGYGLLCGAPGRGQSLTADSGLGPRTDRMVTWLGPPDSRAVRGIGLQARNRSWRLRGMSGRRTASPAGAPLADHLSAVQLGYGGASLRISAACLREYRSLGASLAGGWNRGEFSGDFETLAWRQEPNIPVTGAAVLRLRWRLGRAAGLEGQWGFADLPSGPGLASRPQVLPGWSGQGTVLRGFIRGGPGLEVRALIHLAQHLDRVGVRNKYRKVLADLQVYKKWGPRFDLAVRYRGTGTQGWSWSPRYPWLPPEAGRQQKKSILSVQFNGRWSGLQGGFLVRTYGLDSLSGSGRRSLVKLSARFSPAGNLKLRGAWVTAWGDPVDLVSAIVPVAGMVLPRHWGTWRSETVLGAEWSARRARLQGAGSWRQPEGLDRVGALLTVWLEAGYTW